MPNPEFNGGKIAPLFFETTENFQISLQLMSNHGMKREDFDLEVISMTIGSAKHHFPSKSRQKC